MSYLVFHQLSRRTLTVKETPYVRTFLTGFVGAILILGPLP
jgi:hypothetical protein